MENQAKQKLLIPFLDNMSFEISLQIKFEVYKINFQDKYKIFSNSNNFFGPYKSPNKSANTYSEMIWAFTSRNLAS